MKIKILDTEFLNNHKDIPEIFDEYDSLANDYITLLDENNTHYEYGNICADCETFHKQEDLTYIEDKEYYVCDDCLSNSCNYFFCDDCNNWYSTDTNSYETEQGNIICEECADDHYVQCSDCGRMVHESNYYYCEDCQCYFCYSCWGDHYHEEGNIYSYHDFNDWELHQTDDELTPPFYIGHELEIDYGDHKGDAADLIYQKLPCICMEDGSLSSNGIEIISHPLSYNYMLSKENEYRDTFKQLSENYNYKSHNTGDCGLHFHVTRPDDETIDRILLFMETYKEEIIRLSRRTNGELSSWANFLSDRRTTPNEKELKSLDYIKKNKETSYRYMALNLTNYRTIEYRFFKGTLKYETFMADFEFVYFLTKLAMDHTIPIEELTWEKVVNNGRFLHSYIDGHDLHSNKPMHDYTQEVLIEINRQKEELKKEALRLLKETFDRMKVYLKKTQTLNYNTLYTIHDKIYYGNNTISNIRDVLGKLEYSDLDKHILEEQKYKLEQINTFMNNYLQKEEK